MQAAKATAQRLGLDLQVLEFRNADDLGAALHGGVRAGIKGLVALTSPITDRNAAVLADFTVKNQLPGIAPYAGFVRAGGLMSYGPDLRRPPAPEWLSSL
jgi:putative ABC transport system substrate-binding protein